MKRAKPIRLASSVRLGVVVIAALLGYVAGCSSSGQPGSGEAQKDVVVYTALDEEFSAPILDDFVLNSGIQPLPKYDVESTKTVGLVSEIIAEAQRPRCDVFWNNEILNTLRLEKLGLLEPYRSPAAAPFDAQWKSQTGTWYGFAARARILLVNEKLTAGKTKPASIVDLTDPKWRGQIGIAKPLFGTTATQAACLFAVWGDEKAEDFFKKLKANGVQVLGGNKRVAEAVAAGQLAFGLTDTDDAMGEIDQGMPVEIVYPDQGAGEVGTLFIPNTVAIIKGGPHPEAARKLVDYLLTPAVETKLAEGASVQIPLNPRVHAKLRVETPETIRAMQVDFAKAADKWDAAAKFLREEFSGEE
jgi:iron(III) transport system substrate-binding protein